MLVLLRSAFCKRSLLQVDDELEIKAYYAGHVLGAAMVLIKVGSESVVYTVSATHLVYNVLFIYSWMNQHRSEHQSHVCRLCLNRNNRRPKIEPCGTPYYTINVNKQSDCVLSKIFRHKLVSKQTLGLVY